MKYIILFVLSVVALTKAGPQGHKPPMFQYIDECKGSASDADIAAIMTHANTLPAQAYCVLGCAMKKAGMMTADNKINMDQVKTQFAPIQSHNAEMYQGMISAFESCQPSGTPSECDAAKSIYECTEPKIKALIPMPGGPGGPGGRPQ